MADKTGFNGHLMVCYACVCYVCLYHMFNHTQVVFILSRAILSHYEPLWAIMSHSEPFRAIMSHLLKIAQMAKWPNMAQYGPIWPFANICVRLCISTPELYSDVVCSIWARLSPFETFRARMGPYEPKWPTPNPKWQIKPVLTDI